MFIFFPWNTNLVPHYEEELQSYKHYFFWVFIIWIDGLFYKQGMPSVYTNIHNACHRRFFGIRVSFLVSILPPRGRRQRTHLRQWTVAESIFDMPNVTLLLVSPRAAPEILLAALSCKILYFLSFFSWASLHAASTWGFGCQPTAASLLSSSFLTPWTNSEFSWSYISLFPSFQ